MSRRKQARPIKVHEDELTDNNGINILAKGEHNSLMPCKEIVMGAGGASGGSLHQLSENGKFFVNSRYMFKLTQAIALIYVLVFI